VAAEEWIGTVDHAVAQGLRSPNTAQLYRLNMNVHVLPAVGELRLREITVPSLDRVIQTLQLHKGSATAKIARTVISGILGLAVRHGAISTNPVRDVGRIARSPRSAPSRWTSGSSGSPVFVPTRMQYGRTSLISVNGCSARACASGRPWR
jgi:hypothetical protein